WTLAPRSAPPPSPPDCLPHLDSGPPTRAIRAVPVLTSRHPATPAIYALALPTLFRSTLTLTRRSCELVASLRSTGGDRMTSASGGHSRQTAATGSLRGIFRRVCLRKHKRALPAVASGGPALRLAPAARVGSRGDSPAP